MLPVFKELPWNDKVISDNVQGWNHQENNLKMILMFIIKIYDILYIEKTDIKNY